MQRINCAPQNHAHTATVREDDRGALMTLLEAYGQDFEIREYWIGKQKKPEYPL